MLCFLEIVFFYFLFGFYFPGRSYYDAFSATLILKQINLLVGSIDITSSIFSRRPQRGPDFGPDFLPAVPPDWHKIGAGQEQGWCSSPSFQREESADLHTVNDFTDHWLSLYFPSDREWIRITTYLYICTHLCCISLEELPSNVRNIVRDAKKAEAEIAALKISYLKKVSKGSNIVVMDSWVFLPISHPFLIYKIGIHSGWGLAHFYLPEKKKKEKVTWSNSAARLYIPQLESMGDEN